MLLKCKIFYLLLHHQDGHLFMGKSPSYISLANDDPFNELYTYFTLQVNDGGIRKWNLQKAYCIHQFGHFNFLHIIEKNAPLSKDVW